MSGLEPANSVLIVLRTVGKWIGYAFLLIISLVAAGALTAWVYKEFTYTRHKKAIELTTEYKGDRCTGEYPLLVEVTNKSSKVILSYTFHIKARRPGYSTNLARSYESYSSDRIINPNERWAMCWKIVKDGSGYPKTEYLDEPKLEVEAVDVLFTFAE